jgi:hypothetical protein
MADILGLVVIEEDQENEEIPEEDFIDEGDGGFRAVTPHISSAQR